MKVLQQFYNQSYYKILFKSIVVLSKFGLFIEDNSLIDLKDIKTLIFKGKNIPIFSY